MNSFFSKYSWQQKNKALWWGALVFLFIVYQASIKKTLEVRRTYQEVSSAQINTLQKEQELAQLKERLRNVGNGQLINSDEAVDQKTGALNKVAAVAEANGLTIKDVPATQTIAADGLKVYYDEYCLVGSYDQLLQCWYEIEQGKELNIVSVSFRKENNVLTKTTELKMYLTTAYVSTL